MYQCKNYSFLIPISIPIPRPILPRRHPKHRIERLTKRTRGFKFQLPCDHIHTITSTQQLLAFLHPELVAIPVKVHAEQAPEPEIQNEQVRYVFLHSTLLPRLCGMLSSIRRLTSYNASICAKDSSGKIVSVRSTFSSVEIQPKNNSF